MRGPSSATRGVRTRAKERAEEKGFLPQGRRGAGVFSGGGDAGSCAVGVWRRVLVLVLVLGSIGLSEEVEGRWRRIEYEYRPSG